MAKMEKFFFQFKYEEPRLIMSHAHRLGLSYQRFALASKCQTFFCKNGFEWLTHSFCIYTWGMHFPLGSNPLTQKIRNVCIFW